MKSTVLNCVSISFTTKFAIMNKIYRVEESTDTEKAPLLKTVLEENSEQLVNSWDYFAYLLHAFMLETGFKLRNESHRKPDCYSFQYELANQESGDLAHCSVNIHRIGPIMTIIGNYHGLEERVSFVSSTIKIGDIVCDQRYTNLRSVSKEFKDKIALPLLVKMQEHHGLVPFNILQFPVEILVQIAEKLSDAKTIKSFIGVACFHEFRIHEFFFTKNVLLSFKVAAKCLFLVKINSFSNIFYLNRKILPCFNRKQEKFREKKFMDS